MDYWECHSQYWDEYLWPKVLEECREYERVAARRKQRIFDTISFACYALSSVVTMSVLLFGIFASIYDMTIQQDKLRLQTQFEIVDSGRANATSIVD